MKKKNCNSQRDRKKMNRSISLQKMHAFIESDEEQKIPGDSALYKNLNNNEYLDIETHVPPTSLKVLTTKFLNL